MAVVFPAELSVALRDRRCSIASQARGRTLDLGGWTDHVESYREDVELTTIDLEALDTITGRFDSVVSLVRTPLVVDLPGFLESIIERLAPQGHAYFLEPTLRAGELGRTRVFGGRMSRPLTGPLAGLHLDRDIPDEIRRAGLFVTDLHRFEVPSVAAAIRPFVEAWSRRPTPTGSAGLDGDAVDGDGS